MMRYVLEIAFLGTRYAGWQMQPNAETVQGVLDRALSLLLRHPVQSIGAGRTDAGVHATQLLVHFDTTAVLTPHFLDRLNGILPQDIVVKNIFIPQNQEFNARFDAISRTYNYFISPHKNAFLAPYYWYLRRDLNLEKMNEAADVLKLHTDFASFAKSGGQNKTTLCDMMEAKWEMREGVNAAFGFLSQGLPCYVFTIKANRFLRGMVRGIVGTMVLVGEEKMSVEEFQAILTAQDRKEAASNAPAHGLYLVDIGYPVGTFLADGERF